MKIAHISDLHFDWNSEEYVDLAKLFAKEVRASGADLLLIGGDIATDKKKYKKIIGVIADAGVPTFVVPGNHCLWKLHKDSQKNSKYLHDEELPNICLDSGVHPLWTAPRIVDGVLFAGSYGHYDLTFTLPQHESPSLRHGKSYNNFQWPDAKYMQWDGFMEEHAVWGKYLNDTALCEYLRLRLQGDLQYKVDEEAPRKKIVLLHTCPFREGLVLKDDQWNAMSGFIGSVKLGNLLVKERVDYVVYGHTHVNKSFNAGGVEAVNSAFGYQSMGEWGNCQSDALCRIRESLKVVDI